MVIIMFLLDRYELAKLFTKNSEEKIPHLEYYIKSKKLEYLKNLLKICQKNKREIYVDDNDDDNGDEKGDDDEEKTRENLKDKFKRFKIISTIKVAYRKTGE